MIRINLLKSPASDATDKGPTEEQPRTQWISAREAWGGAALLVLAGAALFYLAGRRTVYQTGASPAAKASREQERQRLREGKSVETARKPTESTSQKDAVAESRSTVVQDRAASTPSRTPSAKTAPAAPGSAGPAERPKQSQPTAAVAEGKRAIEAPPSSTPPGGTAAEVAAPHDGGFHLSQFSVETRPDGLTVAIRVEPGVVYRTMTLDNPGRVVIDFPDCRLAAPPPYSWPVSGSPVHGVRVGQFRLEPPVVRMVLDVTSIPKYEIHPSATGLEIRVAGGQP